jgi:hypothetical protein
MGTWKTPATSMGDQTAGNGVKGKRSKPVNSASPTDPQSRCRNGREQPRFMRRGERAATQAGCLYGVELYRSG